MKPDEISKNLLIIASKIEASKNPKKELVLRDLRKILAVMDETSTEEMVSVQVPKAVQRFFQEFREGDPTFTEEQSWAAAWQAYCNDKKLNDPSCPS